jgi:DNA-binding CsgD family transcriptional regulator
VQFNTTASAVAGPAILADLQAAASEGERQRMVAAMVHALGFDWLACMRMDPAEPRPGLRWLSATQAGPSWVQRYIEQQYGRVDPRLRIARESGRPVVWTVQELQAGVAGAPPRSAERRFVDELRGTGVRCGVMVATTDREDGCTYVASLLSHTAPGPWLGEGIVTRVLALAACLYALRRGARSATAGADVMELGLSSAQREVLARLTHGWSDKQIADDIGTTTHAVDYHLRRLRKKFGVRNRLQLVQAALHSDLAPLRSA